MVYPTGYHAKKEEIRQQTGKTAKNLVFVVFVVPVYTSC